MTTIATSPLTLLVLRVGSVRVVCSADARPGGLRRLFGLYPAVRATLGGLVVATLFAGLAEGVGLNVLGAARPRRWCRWRRSVRCGFSTTPMTDTPGRPGPHAHPRCDTAPPVTRPSGEVLA